MMSKIIYKRNIFRKISLFPMLLFLILTSGCSLAAGSGDGAQARDRLIGGMITRDYIEKTDAVVEKDNGKIQSLTFDGIDGSYVIYDVWEDENGYPIYSTIMSDGMDVSSHYGVHDSAKKEESTNTIELKIQAHVLTDNAEEKCTFYLNPIYMTVDGRIYAVAGNSSSLSYDAIGATMGWSINKTSTMKWGDSKKEMKVIVSVEGSLAEKPAKISICQMDRNHNTLIKEDYVPHEVPKIMTVENETEYVMILTERIMSNGETIIDRQAVSFDGYTTYMDENDTNGKEQNASLVMTDYTKDNSFVLKHPLWILWQ